MPPKGWRKNQEGSHPVHTKERDQISIDDILFPKATVTRLAKGVLPQKTMLSKDSTTAIQRSATAFVSYLLVSARQNAKFYDRKTINPQDVLAALKECEFGNFTEHVQTELDSFQEKKEQAKLLKKQNQQQEQSATGNPEGEEEEQQQQQTGNADAEETTTTKAGEGQGEVETNADSNATVEDVEETNEKSTDAEEPQTKKARTTKEDEAVSETTES